jgi:hypothetical protein
MMFANLYWLALVVAALLPPKAYRVRIWINSSRAAANETARVTAALERGLYLDSLIIKGAPTPVVPLADPRDSVGWENRTRAAMIRGDMDESGGKLEIRVQLLNILLRPMAGPDTIRVDRASLDSAVVARGRDYAKVLAKIR